MDTEHRRHPRIPTNKPCSIRSTEGEHRIDATTFCVATHGLGLRLIAPDTSMFAVDDCVTISVLLEGEPKELSGTIAWVEPGSYQFLSLGIRFDADSLVAPVSYVQWVEHRYANLREQSLALGGELAFKRKISLRTYQEALDQQARDGGYLEDYLQLAIVT